MGAEERVAQALRLLEQIEAHFASENGLIDPVDHDRFTAFELLQVADGKATLYNLAWGQDNAPDNIYDQHKRESEQLATWNARMASERSDGDGR